MSKIFFLDTSVILDSTENVFKLSQDGENTIIVCDTVLDEVDAKKSGFDVINYNAREFNRFCEEAELIETDNIGNAKRVIIKNGNVVVHFISLLEPTINKGNTDIKILNDRRIIDTASKITSTYQNIIVLSNDIAFRTRVIIEGLQVEAFKNKDNKDIEEVDFFVKIEVQEDVKFPISIDMYPEHRYKTGFEFVNVNTGKPFYAYRDKHIILPIEEDFLQKQNCVPINIRQKVLSHLMLSESNDIVVITGAAGCSLPGSNVEIKMPFLYVDKKTAIKELGIKVTTLNGLVRTNYMQTNDEGLYDLNSVSVGVKKILSDFSKYSLLLYKDKEHTSKYLKFEYWLGFNDVEFSAKKVKVLRRNKRFFENISMDNPYFAKFNKDNFQRSIMAIQSKLINDKGVL